MVCGGVVLCGGVVWWCCVGLRCVVLCCVVLCCVVLCLVVCRDTSSSFARR